MGRPVTGWVSVTYKWLISDAVSMSDCTVGWQSDKWVMDCIVWVSGVAWLQVGQLAGFCLKRFWGVSVQTDCRLVMQVPCVQSTNSVCPCVQSTNCMSLCAVYKLCMSLCAVYKLCMSLCAVYKLAVSLCAVCKLAMSLCADYKLCMSLYAVYKLAVSLCAVYKHAVSLCAVLDILFHCNGRLYVYSSKARQSMLTKLWLPFSAVILEPCDIIR
jgi:hypothetical protein